MNKKEHCCCFTGHRVIPPQHIDIIKNNLPIKIRNLAKIGVTDFIAGGALGFDTLSATLVLNERSINPDIRLILALPCKNQTAGWAKKDVFLYNKICSLADEVIYVSEKYSAACMHKRNEFMCNKSNHCIFYISSTRGGTAYTVKYAIESGLTLHNVML